MIQRFLPSLEYDTMLAIPDALYPRELQWVDGRLLVGARGRGGAPYLVLSADGAVRSTFHEWPAEVLETPYWGSVVLDHGVYCAGRVVVATSLLYPMQAYDLDGASLGAFGEPPRSWRAAPRPRAGELSGPNARRRLAEWLEQFTIIDRLGCHRPSGRLLVAHGRYTPTGTPNFADMFLVTHYGVDIYDGRGGAWVKRYEDVPLPGRLLHVGEYVYILLAEPPDPWTVGVYAPATRDRR